MGRLVHGENRLSRFFSNKLLRRHLRLRWRFVGTRHFDGGGPLRELPRGQIGAAWLCGSRGRLRLNVSPDIWHRPRPVHEGRSHQLDQHDQPERVPHRWAKVSQPADQSYDAGQKSGKDRVLYQPPEHAGTSGRVTASGTDGGTVFFLLRHFFPSSSSSNRRNCSSSSAVNRCPSTSASSSGVAAPS